MNSSTSSSKGHRRYVQGLLALIVAPWSALLAMGVYLQPLHGDLTRIGTYAERDFGWNKPQLEFRQTLFKTGGYDDYFDVVVLGDSFSLGRSLPSWQNYVVAATGWSVLTLDARKVRLVQIFENPVFRERPPRLFIFESVERQVPHRVTRPLPCDPERVPVAGGHAPPVPLGEFRDLAGYVKREISLSDIKPDFVLKYLRKELTRRFAGDAPTDAPSLALSRQAPFSSANRRELLVFKDDMRKIEWWRRMTMQEKVCRMEGLRKRVEANGRTRFVLMLAPDKLTAYSDFLADSKLRDVSVLSQFVDQLAHISPRLDESMASAIRQGEEDVYLPNDTHWGSAGHRIAAETLLGFLQR